MSTIENPIAHGVTMKTDKAAAPEVVSYPHSLTRLATIINGEVTPQDKYLIAKVDATNWRKRHWDVTDPAQLSESARALAIGIPVFHPFANFAALTFNPHLESMRTVNAAKGREPGQVASLTTTREHIPGIFDWTKLPNGLDQQRVLHMIDTFYDFSKNPYAGPFGFRGPAADHIPDHLTTKVTNPATGETMRTVQIIAPGYDDIRSNQLFEQAIAAANERRRGGPELTYLAITSANISSHKTGKDEPAHYKLVAKHGLKSDFGNRAPGFVILGEKDEDAERAVRNVYPHHDPNSTTILDFSRSSVEGEQTSIFMARHGSLSDAITERVLAHPTINLGLLVDEHARSSLEMRHYDERTALARAADIVRFRRA